MSLRAPATLAALALVGGCESTPDTTEREFVFESPTMVWQSSQGGAQGVWLAEGGGGRAFAILGAALPDGSSGVYAIERRGDDWGAAVPFARPAGASSEKVESVGAWPSPIVVSVAAGAAGTFVTARTFAGAGWSAATALSTPGAERAVIARVAESSPFNGASPTAFDVVYGVASSVCPEGVELRHRRSDGRPLLTAEDAPTWGAARPVGLACGAGSLAAAASEEAVMVAWVGGASGAKDLYAVRGRRAEGATAFEVATVVQRGENRDVSAAPLGDGHFLLGWSPRSRAADGTPSGLQRAAWARFDATLSAWSRVDTGWFFSSTAPVVRGDGAAEALALGSDGDFPSSPLALRRWTLERAVRSRSVVGTTLGTVRAGSFLRMRDGSVEVIWLEDAPQGAGQRVMWTRGARVVSSDAGV
ncbi:MAG: hypothetical protein R3A48_05135 [Polyangiales bacterium]